jgi:hypothetical protein
MKCISIRQPWASLIASGQKTVELRTWTTKYRGPLIVCASAAPTKDTHYPIGPMGVTICLVELVDIRRPIPTDSACVVPSERDWAWALGRVTHLPAVAVKGRLSLWEPQPDLIRQLGLTG